MNLCLLLSKVLGSRKGPVGFTLSGTITGDEVEGATIALTGDATDSTTSAADGTYSFTGLSNGDYTLTPTLTDYTFSPTSINVTISSADDVDNDFVSTAVYTISGTISGDVADGVTITLTGDASDSTTSSGGGLYSFIGLPNGSYTVTPSLSGYEFTPASTNVTISDADDTDTDFVSAGPYVVLPYTLDFDSFATGAVQEEDGFFRLEGSAGIATIALSPADSNSYSIPDVSKAMLLANGVTYHTVHKFPNSAELKSGFSTIRLAVLYYHTGGTAGPYVTVSVDNYEDNGDSNSTDNLKAVCTPMASGNTLGFVQFVVGGSVTQKDVRGAANTDSTRWMWTRAQISTSGSHSLYWVRKEDSSQLDTTTNALALGAINNHKHIGIILDAGPAGSCYIAKLWIGSGTDDWPT